MTQESFLIMLSISLIAIAWMVIALTYIWAYNTIQTPVIIKQELPQAVLI